MDLGIVLPPLRQALSREHRSGIRRLEAIDIAHVRLLLLGHVESHRLVAARVGQIADDQLVDLLRVSHREAPGDAAPPVVAHENDIGVSQVVDHGHHVALELVALVRLDLRRLATPVVASQVHGCHTVRVFERFHLHRPGQPLIRKTVQKEDGGALAGGVVGDLHPVGALNRVVLNAMEDAFLFGRCEWQRDEAKSDEQGQGSVGHGISLLSSRAALSAARAPSRMLTSA